MSALSRAEEWYLGIVFPPALYSEKLTNIYIYFYNFISFYVFRNTHLLFYGLWILSQRNATALIFIS